MASDLFEEQIKQRREQEAANTSEALKAIEAKSIQEAQARRLSAERARLAVQNEKAVIDTKLYEQRAAAARDAARREKLNESETRMVSMPDIVEAISNKRLASVFSRKNDFLDNPDSTPAYVMDFVIKAAETVTEAQALNDPEFSGERFFDVLLNGYRRVPKLCMEALWLILNVESFNDRVAGWPDQKRIEMKMRSLAGSMGKGILSANHLIKSEILKIRSGAGGLHEGPLFKELNTLFKDKGERYDERLRIALKLSWMFSYAEMAKAGIPERYRLNMDATDEVTLLLKIIIAETAMERHPYGPNLRRKTLPERDRISEIVKNTGRELPFKKPAVTEWIRTHDGLTSVELTYFPMEISAIEHEGLTEYSQTLLDCATAAFPEAPPINAPLFTEIVKKLLTAQFSVKKKFTMKLAPAPGALCVTVLDHDGETVIRELNIPNTTSAAPAQSANGSIPAVMAKSAPAEVRPMVATPATPSASAVTTPARPATAPPYTAPASAVPLPHLQHAPVKKRRLDLDLG
jgi:hypothetical protein